MAISSSELNSWLANGAHIIYADTAKPTKRITTLAEVFLEYYLFDTCTAKSIDDFLSDEHLDDVFTSGQIMDLMCGTAYMNEEMVSLVHSKLPFEINIGRLHKLNANAAKSGAIEIIPCNVNLVQKEAELKKEKVRRTKSEYNRRYREKHADKIKAYQKELYLQNREQRKESARARYYKNRSANIAKSRQYYKDNLAACVARDKKYYRENREYILARNRQYREKNPNANKDNYQKIKARKELAKSMCPVFIFLCELRATNIQKYLTKYKRVQDIPGQAIRAGCDALSVRDISLCPIVVGGVAQCDKCPMHAAFEFENAVSEIQRYARDIANEHQK